jgi:6-phosphogluconolactonase (cycloisomerase 2 family)
MALLAAVGLVAAPLASAGGKKRPKKPRTAGYVYTQTNDTTSNAVIKFRRLTNGQLRRMQTVKTGGVGSTQSVGCGPGCPILDSASAVDMTPNGKFVFTVNAGSDQVVSMRETATGLKRVEVEPSGGDLPESVTANADGLLYVLNVDSNTISGFRYSPSSGALTPIPGSTRPLAAATSTARQIGFDNSGETLIVTNLGAGLVEAFTIGADGTPTALPPHSSQTPLPFGFAFDPSNRLLVSEITVPPPPMGPGGNGSTSSYGVSSAGAVTDIDSEGTNDELPCWVVITGNGRHAYVVNTGAGKLASITRFRINTDGTLTRLGNTSAPGEFAITDAVLSRGSKYLYVLAPTVTGPKRSRIRIYRVFAGGGLRFLGRTPSNLPTSVTGLDGR